MFLIHNYYYKRLGNSPALMFSVLFACHTLRYKNESKAHIVFLVIIITYFRIQNNYSFSHADPIC